MYITTYLSLVVTTLFWGGTFIAGRALAGTVPPATAAFLRFGIATLALLALCRLIDGRLHLPPPRMWFSLLVLGLTGVFSYNICFFNGLQHIEAGRAALIIALNPLVITLSTTLLWGEPLSLRQFGGVLLSLVGALFVISNGHPLVIMTGGFGKGELFILCCVVSWTIYSLVGRSVLKSIPPLAAVFYSSAIGCLLLLGPALREGSLGRVLHYPPFAFLSLGFLGLFGTAIGFSMYYQAIRKIGPSRASVFINLVPLFAILLGWGMLNEAIKPSVLTGGITILIGVSLTNLKTNKQDHPAKSPALPEEQRATGK